MRSPSINIFLPHAIISIVVTYVILFLYLFQPVCYMKTVKSLELLIKLHS